MYNIPCSYTCTNWYVSAQTVLNESLPQILIADSWRFPDELKFTNDSISVFMVEKALRYVAAGKLTRTLCVSFVDDGIDLTANVISHLTAKVHLRRETKGNAPSFYCLREKGAFGQITRGLVSR